MARTPVIVRHVGLRHVSQDEVVQALGGMSALERVPIEVELNTAQFSDEIENGSWSNSHGEVWRRAEEIHNLLRETSDARLIYASGNPEVPHAIAFGAYVGDHWPIEPYDRHESGTLTWPNTERTLELGEPVGLPRETMSAAGPAVLRVEITSKIQDEHVRQFVADAEQVADVRIVPQGVPSGPGLVRSLADVAEIRRAVRMAVAALTEHRPKLTVIHLFVAAPVSACVVTGQELRLRNNPPVQTYRFRRAPDGSGATTEAIRLSATGPSIAEVPLTAEQSARAATLRTELWAPAVADVERYAERKRREAERAGAVVRERWYDALPWKDSWVRVRPFPALPPMHQVVERPAGIDPVSIDVGFFGFQREDRIWRINDRFSVRLDEGFPDPTDARALLRMFLFHEYLHVVHGITKASFEEVGKFANGLERADYMCDLYGVLHELDWEADEQSRLLQEFEQYKRRIGELIDLVLRSYWTFELPAPLKEMEVRRMRRYLNWYWQQVRVRMARSPFQLAAILARPPIVEIAGLETRAEGRRHFASLRRFDRGVGMELGITLDSEQLHRVKTGVTTPLDELVRAFREQDHTAIQQVFRGVYAEVEGTGHALSSDEDLP